MTRLQLIAAVAEATGESRRTIRALGFHLEPPDRALRPTPARRLFVACPPCRRPGADPGTARAGMPILAECGACDLLVHPAPAAGRDRRPTRAPGAVRTAASSKP